jgi:hypothetical protein
MPADRSVIVGTSRHESDGYRAYIWDGTNGTQLLERKFANEYGLDLTGWSLTSVIGISADGITIIGRGSKDGIELGWIADLTPPADTDSDGTPDWKDNCPNDPNKIVPGICGCGIADEDSDGDGILDCEDANDDNDGVPDGEEKGPEGNDPNYDGNGDGTADCMQENVASFHSYDKENYVTVESEAGVSISNGEVQDNPSESDAPSGVEFPYGLFSFNLDSVGMGSATAITLHLPAGQTLHTYYKYGPSLDNFANHWYEFLYDGQTGAEINGNVVTLHFVDGMRGDDDLAADGVVTEVGAPAVAIGNFESTFAPGGDGGDGGGGCFIDSVVKSLTLFRPPV